MIIDDLQIDDLQKDLPKFWQEIQNNTSEYKVMISSFANSLAYHYLNNKCEYFSFEGLLCNIDNFVETYNKTGKFPQVLFVDLWTDDAGKNYAKSVYTLERIVCDYIEKITGKKMFSKSSENFENDEISENSKNSRSIESPGSYRYIRRALFSSIHFYTFTFGVDRGLIKKADNGNEYELLDRTQIWYSLRSSNQFKFAQIIRLQLVSKENGLFLQNSMFPWIHMTLDEYALWRLNILNSNKWSNYKAPEFCSSLDTFVANEPSYGSQVLVARQINQNDIVVTSYCLFDSILNNDSVNSKIYSLLLSSGHSALAEKYRVACNYSDCRTSLITLLSGICTLHSSLLDGQYNFSGSSFNNQVYGYGNKADFDLHDLIIGNNFELLNQLSEIFKSQMINLPKNTNNNASWINNLSNMEVERFNLRESKKWDYSGYGPFSEYVKDNQLLRNVSTIYETPLLCTLLADGYIEIGNIIPCDFNKEHIGEFFISSNFFTIILDYLQLEEYYGDLLILEKYIIETGLKEIAWMMRFGRYLEENYSYDDGKNNINNIIRYILNSGYNLRDYVPQNEEVKTKQRELIPKFMQDCRNGKA